MIIESVALSDVAGDQKFYFDPKGGSPTDGLSNNDVGMECAVVTVRLADEFLNLTAPTAIKIDVEGFELNVLKGMSRTLNSESLKAVFLEVHFQELAEMGLRDAPREIVRVLSNAGFSIRWTDSSHICALKQRLPLS